MSMEEAVKQAVGKKYDPRKYTYVLVTATMVPTRESKGFKAVATVDGPLGETLTVMAKKLESER